MKSARLYHCVRCRHQCVICSDCDRGNIYCGSSCAQQARIQNHRIANQLYQKTFRGKQKHAVRQRNYRLRQKIKVTDRSSDIVPPNDLLLTTKSDDKKTMSEHIHCYFCKKIVSPYLRNGYLRYEAQDKSFRFNDTG